MNVNCKEKYLEYKNKYLQLKQSAGSFKYVPRAETVDSATKLSCCERHSIAIVKSHGLQNGNIFDLPHGVNVITLTTLDNSIRMSQILDNEIKRFYGTNNYIFENYDYSHVKTPAGIALEGILQRLDPTINIRNHISGQVNDMILNFESGGCNRESCSIDCYGRSLDRYSGSPKSSCKIKRINYVRPEADNMTLEEIIDSILTFDEPEVNRMTLKELIDTERYTVDFIIIACRKIPEQISRDRVRLMRQKSIDADSVVDNVEERYIYKF